MFSLDAVMRAAEDLEPMPASVSRLATLIADPDSEVNDIIGVVAYDPTLTVTVSWAPIMARSVR